MPKIKVAGYGRSSTDKQQLSPHVQEEKIRRWFQYQLDQGKWPDGAEFIGMFTDHAVSSRVDMLGRPQGYELMTKLDPGDIIVCATMSRAFRSASDAEKTTNKLEEAGVSLQFVDCAVDTSTPQGKLFLGMIAIMARFERDVISERTRDTLRHKRVIGEAIGHPPIGWKAKYTDGRPVLVPDVSRRMVGVASAKLIRDGVSFRQLELQMKHYTEKHSMDVPCSGSSLTKAAMSACLDFPKLSLMYQRKLLGENIANMKFVKGDEHEHYKQKLQEAAEKEGLVLWENTSVVK